MNRIQLMNVLKGINRLLASTKINQQKSGINIKVTFIKYLFPLFLLCEISLFSQNITIDGGYEHAILLCNDGTVWHTGDRDGNNQDGSGLVGKTNQFTAVPGVGGVGNLSSIKAITAGSDGHSLALTTNGEVIAFGANYAGQLGLSLSGGVLQEPVPYPVYVENIGGGGRLAGISAVAGTSESSYAIRVSDARVIAWGSNAKGQIGTATADLVQEVPILISSNEMVNIIKISGGDYFALALRNDGTVWAWGENTNGQCGQGNNSTQYYSTPVQVLQAIGVPLTGITDIIAGDAFCLAKKSDGTLWAWGANDEGQLGQGLIGAAADQDDRYMAVQVHTGAQNDPSTFFTNVNIMVAGNAHATVLTNDGALYSFGKNTNGQLGDNTTTMSSNPVRVKTGAQNDASTFLSNIVGLARGDNWTYVIDNQNKLYSWGKNDKGQLGLGIFSATKKIPGAVSSLSCSILPCGDTALTSMLSVCSSAGTFDLNFYNGTSAAGTWSITNGPVGYSAIVDGHTFSNTLAGTYTVRHTLTSVNPGCPAYAERTFTLFALPVVTFTLPDDAMCISDPLVALSGGSPAGGAYSGTGVTTGTSFTPSAAGTGNKTLTYTYTNGNSCTNTATDVMTVNALPVVTFTLPDDAMCISDPLVALSGGSPAGGAYSGTGVSTNSFDPKIAGFGQHIITYTYTDNNSCSSSATDIITVTPFPAPDINMNSNFCLNVGLQNLIASPASGTWSINDNSCLGCTQFDPLNIGSGQHELKYTYTDNSGCTSSDSVVITVDTIPVVLISPFASEFCANDFAVTMIASPLNGSWTLNGNAHNNRFDPSSLVDGSTNRVKYSYVDGNGCGNSDSVDIIINSVTPVNFVLDGNKVCSNGNEINLSGGLPLGGIYSGIAVNNSKFNPSGLATGAYAIIYTYTNAKGCVNSAEDTMNVVSPSLISITPKSICMGDNTTFSAPSFAAYQWSGPNGYTSTDNTILVNLSGTYNFIITNNDGCVTTGSTTLSQYALPQPDLGNDKSLCANEKTTLNPNVSGTNSYLWSNGEISSDIEVQTAGEYWVKISDNNNCVTYDTVKVSFNALPQVFLGNDTSVCDNGLHQITLSAKYTITPTQLLWSTGATGDSIAVSNTGTYWVEITDSNSCSAKDEIEVNKFCEPFIFDWPNVFTPNGDDYNETFHPHGLYYSQFEEFFTLVEYTNLTIFDRWGVKVFESSNAYPEWSGLMLKTNNENSSGTYYWIFEYQYKEGIGADQSKKSQSGYVTLMQ